MSPDFSHIRYFKPEEFPPGELPLADQRILSALDAYRGLLGRTIVPSPIKGALARPDASAKGSRHYAIGRQSDAVDCFPSGNVVDAWRVAVMSGLFGGIGYYLDTMLGPMLHLDLRPERLWWARIKGEYYYPIQAGLNRETFFRGLASASV